MLDTCTIRAAAFNAACGNIASAFDIHLLQCSSAWRQPMCTWAAACMTRSTP